MSAPDDPAAPPGATAERRGQNYPVEVSAGGRRVLLLAVCCLGVSSLITQLTLMRELLCVFSGNELVLGVVLGNWLLLCGIGSALGRTASRLRDPLAVLVPAQIAVALLPIAAVLLLRTMRNVVFVRAAEVGVTETVASCFVLLAPYCLIAGYLLTLACRILAAEGDKGPSKNDPASIGQVYFLDNIGDVIGGLLFSFVLIWLLGHFGILYVPAMLNLLMACWVAVLARRRILAALAAAATLATVALIAAYDLDGRSIAGQYAPQQVVFHGNSPYGSLVLTRLGRQVNFIQNGVPLFSTGDVETAEATVHYAMAQRPAAKRVLLISGGVSGTAREVLKYGVEAADYVELDPLIIEVARDFLPGCLDDERIRVITTDGRLHVKQTEQRYGVAIVDVPDPSTFQLNRFYTREFFDEVHRVLVEDGVLSFSLGSYANFIGRQRADLIAVGHRTLSAAFDNVLVFPDQRSGRLLFLASDGPLTTQIAQRLEHHGIDTQLMHPGYLKTVLERMDDVRAAFTDEAPVSEVPVNEVPVNEDLSPLLCYYNLRLWMSKFDARFGLLEVVLLVSLAVYLVRIRPVPLVMFTTGLAASALEVVLLVGFQVLYGSVYHQLGVIVTMFMLGLGVGALAVNRTLARRKRRDLFRLQMAMATFAALLPLVLMGLAGLGGAVAAAVCRVVIPLLALLLAVIVGMAFPLAGKADFQAVTATASRLYTADYLGAALGALLVSTLLIPLLGVAAVCLLTAGLNVISGLVILATSGK